MRGYIYALPSELYRQYVPCRESERYRTSGGGGVGPGVQAVLYRSEKEVSGDTIRGGRLKDDNTS